MRRLAIDPGDVHVGYAYDDGDNVSADEWSPAECVDQLVFLLTNNQVDEIIVEEFVLYAWEAEKQAWSALKTSQLIGGVKVIARWFDIPVVEQGAYIKKPTRKQLRARGIKHTGVDIHARDAELHLWYRRLRAEKEEKQHADVPTADG